jgi:hypothetical protein
MMRSVLLALPVAACLTLPVFASTPSGVASAGSVSPVTSAPTAAAPAKSAASGASGNSRNAKSRQSAAAPVQPQVTPAAAQFAEWYRQFVEQKGLAAKGEICIRSRTCISDESDYFRHIEAAYNIQKGIEAYAAQGYHDASYYAGLIAFEEAKRFDRHFQIYGNFKDDEYRRAGARLLELSDRETRRAKALLYPAAYAGHPESCMLMGEVIEFERLGPPDIPALVFYYCAAREYYLRGNRNEAFRAYGGMLRTGHPQDPMIVEMHIRLYDKQPPNLWRPITKPQPQPAADAAPRPAAAVRPTAAAAVGDGRARP